jgi:LmbE family N-acetylglucosaminyl deacetylase
VTPLRVLVIAPHPDDEVLGVGGTIARHSAEGAEVSVVIVTKGYPPEFGEALVRQGREEARCAHEILGVRDTIFLSFPAAGLDMVPHSALNAELGAVLTRVQPDVLYVPFNGDLHRDHQRVFASALVAARPGHANTPQAIYAYETLSETNWNAPFLAPGFAPNVFVDISEYVGRKAAAMRAFASQLKPAPHERSIETLHALATLRGSTVGCKAAEAFVLVRQIR